MAITLVAGDGSAGNLGYPQLARQFIPRRVTGALETHAVTQVSSSSSLQITGLCLYLTSASLPPRWGLASSAEKYALQSFRAVQRVSQLLSRCSSMLPKIPIKSLSRHSAVFFQCFHSVVSAPLYSSVGEG